MRENLANDWLQGTMTGTPQLHTFFSACHGQGCNMDYSRQNQVRSSGLAQLWHFDETYQLQLTLGMVFGHLLASRQNWSSVRHRSKYRPFFQRWASSIHILRGAFQLSLKNAIVRHSHAWCEMSCRGPCLQASMPSAEAFHIQLLSDHERKPYTIKAASTGWNN